MKGAQPHVGYLESLGAPPASGALYTQAHQNGVQPHIDYLEDFGPPPITGTPPSQAHLNGVDGPKGLTGMGGPNGFATSGHPLPNGHSKPRMESPFMIDNHQLSRQSPGGANVRSPPVISPQASSGGPMWINERGPSLGLGRRRSNLGDQAKDAFWKQNLVGKPPLLLLPVDKPRTAASSLADALQVSPLPSTGCSGHCETVCL